MARACLPLLLALVLVGTSAVANAQQTFSSLPTNYEVVMRPQYNGEHTASHCLENDSSCTPQISIPDGDQVVIDYRPLDGTVNTTSTISLFACYAPSSTTDRPWRKPSDTISSDKQCNTKIATGLAPEGSYTYTPGENTPPATYYVLAMEVCTGGVYCGKGRTLGYYSIIPIDSRPTWLISLVAVFCCVGPVSLAAFFVGERYMKKRQ